MRPTFILSRETRALVDLFKTMPLQTPISFSEASERVKFCVQSTLPAYHMARKIVERDHGVFIASIRGFGFMRGNGSDMAKSGEGIALSIRKKSKRGASRMELALRQNLNKQEALRASELFNRFNIIHSTAEPHYTRSNRVVTDEVPIA